MSRRRWLVAVPVLTAGAVAVLSLVGPSPGVGSSAPVEQGTADDLGAELYATQCASCHATDGRGVTDRGPPLTDEGRAAVDFVLRTGRMPMADPDMQAQRGPVRFSEEEIVALVDYAGAFGDGPDIPVVDPEAGDLAAGSELYQLNCASCHVASGSGASIGGGRKAPTLMESSATEIGQAIIVGPGAMPVFGSFTDEDIDDVAAYIGFLQDERTTGVRSFGGAGPVAEGLAAWLLGLIPLIAVTRWIGSPHEGRDPPAVDVEDVEEAL